MNSVYTPGRHKITTAYLCVYVCMCIYVCMGTHVACICCRHREATRKRTLINNNNNFKENINCLTRINPISPALFTVACPQHCLFAELPPLGKLTGLFLHIRSEWTTGCTTPTYLTDFTACWYRSPLQ